MINLIHGDCIEEMAKMDANSVDLTVTSPPYDNLRTYDGSLQWSEDIWKQVLEGLHRVTKDGGVVVWVVGDATIKGSETGTSFKQALFAKECGFNLHDTMIWEKQNCIPMYPTIKRYDLSFEYMFVFSKGHPKSWNPIKDRIKADSSKQREKYNTAYTNASGVVIQRNSGNTNSDFCKRRNVWMLPNGQVRGLKHPAPFPEKLAHDHIISWSNEGDTVFDPFLGSGTTGLASKQLNRNFIGIEKVEKYYDIATARIINKGEVE
jgi:site-specific DNA-methyltransferase (adenine-specific)